MVEIVWTEPALSDLDAIADYIALDDPAAARDLVQRIFRRIEQLAQYPKSGSTPPELKGGLYRQIIEPPCRIFYRTENNRAYVLYVMRSERLLRTGRLRARSKRALK